MVGDPIADSWENFSLVCVMEKAAGEFGVTFAFWGPEFVKTSVLLDDPTVLCVC